jgi:hypothetical protein
MISRRTNLEPSPVAACAPAPSPLRDARYVTFITTIVALGFDNPQLSHPPSDSSGMQLLDALWEQYRQTESMEEAMIWLLRSHPTDPWVQDLITQKLRHPYVSQPRRSKSRIRLYTELKEAFKRAGNSPGEAAAAVDAMFKLRAGSMDRTIRRQKARRRRRINNGANSFERTSTSTLSVAAHIPDV